MAIPVDRLICQCDQMLRTLAGVAEGSGRPSPAATVESGAMTSQQRAHAAGLMRVNHAGEVMAQALYYGQMLLLESDDPLFCHLNNAATEETDHLLWCNQRIRDLGGSNSLLNPIWYLGAFALGVSAGLCGRSYSLGFTAEVEKQVHRHLQSHLDQLPVEDSATRAILAQMQEDEDTHRQQALAAGGASLPFAATVGLQLVSRVMTSLTYRL